MASVIGRWSDASGRTYALELIEKSWSKRRAHVADPLVSKAQIEGLTSLSRQAMCQLLVQYQDGQQQQYMARVLQNQITQVWTLDAMHVALRFVPLVDS